MPKKIIKRPYRYGPLEYKAYKEKKRQAYIQANGKKRKQHAEDSPSSSETSSDDNEDYYTEERLEYFWNEQALAEMQ